MSFTDSQRVKILGYLGSNDLMLGGGADSLALDSLFETVGNNSASQAKVEALLTRIDAVEAAMDSQALVSAGVRKADEIELFEGRSETDLRRRGRALCYQLALVFGLSGVVNDIFCGGPSSFPIGTG